MRRRKRAVVHTLLGTGNASNACSTACGEVGHVEFLREPARDNALGLGDLACGDMEPPGTCRKNGETPMLGGVESVARLAVGESMLGALLELIMDKVSDSAESDCGELAVPGPELAAPLLPRGVPFAGDAHAEATVMLARPTGAGGVTEDCVLHRLADVEEEEALEDARPTRLPVLLASLTRAATAPGPLSAVYMVGRAQKELSVAMPAPTSRGNSTSMVDLLASWPTSLGSKNRSWPCSLATAELRSGLMYRGMLQPSTHGADSPTARSNSHAIDRQTDRKRKSKQFLSSAQTPSVVEYVVRVSAAENEDCCLYHFFVFLPP